jgi:hypothetical protein
MVGSQSRGINLRPNRDELVKVGRVPFCRTKPQAEQALVSTRDIRRINSEPFGAEITPYVPIITSLTGRC